MTNDPEQNCIAADLNFMSDVNQSKSAPEQNQCSGVKFMGDVHNFRVAVGVTDGVVLTATHTATIMSELY